MRTGSGDAEKLIAEARRMFPPATADLSMRERMAHRLADALEAALRAAAPAPAIPTAVHEALEWAVDVLDALARPHAREHVSAIRTFLAAPAPATEAKAMCETSGHETISATTRGVYDDGAMRVRVAYCAECTAVLEPDGEYVVTERIAAPAPVTGLTDETVEHDPLSPHPNVENAPCEKCAALLAASDATGGKARAIPDDGNHSESFEAYLARKYGPNGTAFALAAIDAVWKLSVDQRRERIWAALPTACACGAKVTGEKHDCGNEAGATEVELDPFLLESKDGTSITSASGEVFHEGDTRHTTPPGRVAVERDGKFAPGDAHLYHQDGGA